jgi:hypothetical protein
MNDRGHLEQKNEGQPGKERGDQLMRSPERTPDDKDTHITKGLSDREQVEHTADRIRSELLLTLEELERRRHRAMDVRFQATQHRDLIIGVAITAAVLTGVGVGVAIWRTRHREQILTRHRVKAVKRAWQHPDRLASSADERPLPIELGRKLVLIFASTLASAVAKNAVRGLVPRQQGKAAEK